MVLTLWQGAAESVERLSQADIVVSGGGSAANLMALWKMHGVDHVIRRMIAADSDVVLAGVSAGAACWFSGCLTDAFGDLRAWRGGMGLLDGSFCPHFDGESERAPIYAKRSPTGCFLADTRSTMGRRCILSTECSLGRSLSMKGPRYQGSLPLMSRHRREFCARNSTSPCCDRFLAVVVQVLAVSVVRQVREEVDDPTCPGDIVKHHLVGRGSEDECSAAHHPVKQRGLP